jgi:DNA-binding XRE family transcriptional regulator
MFANEDMIHSVFADILRGVADRIEAKGRKGDGKRGDLSVNISAKDPKPENVKCWGPEKYPILTKKRFNEPMVFAGFHKDGKYAQVFCAAKPGRVISLIRSEFNGAVKSPSYGTFTKRSPTNKFEDFTWRVLSSFDKEESSAHQQRNEWTNTLIEDGWDAKRPPRRKRKKAFSPTKESEEFGTKLKAARLRCGYTQQFIAQNVGISQWGYSNAERGCILVSEDDKAKLVEFLKIED